MRSSTKTKFLDTDVEGDIRYMGRINDNVRKGSIKMARAICKAHPERFIPAHKIQNVRAV